MKILLAHNYYQQRGGEDTVFEAEAELLKTFGETVEILTVHNETIQSPIGKLMAGISTLYNPLTARVISEKIQAFKPDVIHVHNFFPLISPAIFTIAKARRIPVLMTLHNFRLICPNALLFRDGAPCWDCVHKTFPIDGIRHRCYRDSSLQTTSIALMTAFHNMMGTWRNAVDYYITLNNFARARILDSALGLKPEQVLVKPNFVFEPHTEPANPVDQRDYILYVGRLSTEKGIDTLLEGFRNLDYPLKIVGTGPLEPHVIEAASDAYNIEFLGFQDKKNVLALLQHAKGLILPSTCYENFPMTIVEAFSLGIPVITSNTGGLPNIVQNEYNGFLAEPGSVADIRTQVARLFSFPAYDALCRNARKSYLENYTPEKNYTMLKNYYEQAIAKNKALVIR